MCTHYVFKTLIRVNKIITNWKVTSDILECRRWMWISRLWDSSAKYTKLPNHNLPRVFKFSFKLPCLNINLSLQKSDVRIFIALMWSKEMIRTVCESINMGITERHHVWIFDTIRDVAHWWEWHPNLTDCTDYTIQRSINQSFLFTLEIFSPENIMTASGKVRFEFIYVLLANL